MNTFLIMINAYQMAGHCRYQIGVFFFSIEISSEQTFLIFSHIARKDLMCSMH